MNDVRIGIAGVGGYGAYYMEFLLNNPYNRKFCLVGVVDPYVKQSKYEDEIMRRNIPVYDTIEEFYEENKVDLMIISTPIHLHKPQSQIAIENGSVVLCEKPTSALLSDVMLMQEMKNLHQKEIFIGFQLSFTNPILNLKRDLMSEKYGKVIKAKTMVLWERGLDYYARGSGWAGKIKTADGVAIYDSVASNATAHYLHNLLFLLGETIDCAVMPKDINSKCYRVNNIETFDTCVIDLTTQRDQEILFVVSHATKGNVEPKFKIECENATILFDAGGDKNITATMKDGTKVEYGSPLANEEDYQKLIKVIDWISKYEDVNSMEKPPCIIETTIPFTVVMNEIFKDITVHGFDESKIKFDDKKNRMYVEGLYEELVEEYEKG